MLKHIHEEKWIEFHVLTGTAEHLPEAILGLLSTNKKAFDSAFWKIDNYAIVQGDLFSSAAVLPKYLYAVVLKSKYKDHVIDLIWQIGTGYSKNEDLQKECFSESVKTFEKLLEHPDIVSTKYHEMIRNELNDMFEIEADRKRNT